MTTVVCQLRELDGTILATIDGPSPTGPATWKRRGVGESTVDVVLSDAGVGPLLHSMPAGDVPFRTWWDTDLELVWVRDGSVVWQGPVVAVEHRRGVLRVRAWTREGYVLRSVLDADIVELLPEGRWGDDPDLSEWTFTADPFLTADAVAEVVGSPVYRSGESSLHMVAATMVGYADLDAVTDETPVDVRGAYQLGADALPKWEDGEVGSVRLESWDGTTWQPVEDQALSLAPPSGLGSGVWQPFYVRLKQPAGGACRVVVTLGSVYERTITYEPGDIWWGTVSVARPAFAGAKAGQDVAEVVRSVFGAAAAMMPGAWTVDVDDTGTLLVEDVRYWAEAHEDIVSILGDWDAYGEWWVEGTVLRWAPVRGAEVTAVDVSDETLSQWSYEVDGSAAATVMIAQSAVDVEGPREEVEVVAPGAANRLAAVDQATAGLTGEDLRAWAVAELAAKGPARQLTGDGPVSYDGSAPGDVLDVLGLGDWVTCTVVDPPVEYEAAPTVDSLSWQPVSDRVGVSWTLGARRRSLPDQTAATKRADERDRRRGRVAAPTSGRARTVRPEPVVVTGGLGTTYGMMLPFSLPSGRWIVSVSLTLTGAFADLLVAAYDPVTEQMIATATIPGSPTAATSGMASGGSYTAVGQWANASAVPTEARLAVVAEELRT